MTEDCRCFECIVETFEQMVADGTIVEVGVDPDTGERLYRLAEENEDA